MTFPIRDQVGPTPSPASQPTATDVNHRDNPNVERLARWFYLPTRHPTTAELILLSLPPPGGPHRIAPYLGAAPHDPQRTAQSDSSGPPRSIAVALGLRSLSHSFRVSCGRRD